MYTTWHSFEIASFGTAGESGSVRNPKSRFWGDMS